MPLTMPPHMLPRTLPQAPLAMVPRFVATFVGLLAVYGLFAGQVSGTEVLAGVVAALGVAGLDGVLHARRSRDLRLRGARWSRVAVRPLMALLPDAMRVGRVLCAALWRRPSGRVGRVARQPFRHGADDARDAGRRGLVTLGLSLAPNGFVLDLPDPGPGQEGMLLLHRLAPTHASRDPEWPS